MTKSSHHIFNSDVGFLGAQTDPESSPSRPADFVEFTVYWTRSHQRKMDNSLSQNIICIDIAVDIAKVTETSHDSHECSNCVKWAVPAPALFLVDDGTSSKPFSMRSCKVRRRGGCNPSCRLVIDVPRAPVGPSKKVFGDVWGGFRGSKYLLGRYDWSPRVYDPVAAVVYLDLPGTWHVGRWGHPAVQVSRRTQRKGSMFP